ncbi:MAG: TolC family protein [Myxococcales bacterium]|nr:TolC family protein [Myxococcales bacterium]
MRARPPRSLALASLCIAVFATSAGAAEAPAQMTLGEAIELALVRSYAVQLARHDISTAEGQVDEAWGGVYPRVDLSASYTRTLEAPNPFSGSDAGDLFSGFAAQGIITGWFAENERRRQTGEPALAFGDFLDAAGITQFPPEVNTGGGNPFFIPNTVNATLTVTQVLYSGRAFAAIDGAEVYRTQQNEALEAKTREVIQQVSRAYYGALLARAQVDVLDKSIERTKQSVEELSQRVAQGVVPQFQQLSAEVELANLQTRQLQAAATADEAVDGLKLAIGLPLSQQVTLESALSLPEAQGEESGIERSVELAEQRRADLQQLRRTRSLLFVQRRLTAADKLPTITAFFNAGVVGNLPDDPSEPIFSDAYWGPNVNIGVRLAWNLFAGFATDAAIEKVDVDMRRLDTRYEQAMAGVRGEISASLRRLATARERLATQSRNIERAELNYTHAEARVHEGVSAPHELREASQQLDESRFYRLQAVHDILLALIDYELATGTPPAEMRALRLARRGDEEETP